jgi:hypothetical protein
MGLYAGQVSSAPPPTIQEIEAHQAQVAAAELKTLMQWAGILVAVAIVAVVLSVSCRQRPDGYGP